MQNFAIGFILVFDITRTNTREYYCFPIKLTIISEIFTSNLILGYLQETMILIAVYLFSQRVSIQRNCFYQIPKIQNRKRNTCT